MDDTELDALIDAGAKIYGFDIKPEWRAAVRAHLTISLTHTAKVLSTAIDDHVDPAPVYLA
jgi:Protein of unknown function (DUF4089)